MLRPAEEVVVDTEAQRIFLKEKIFFELDKAELKVASLQVLDPLVEVLLGDESLRVRVEGHTDSRGKDAYNMTLSQNRAESVRTYLANKGVPVERMEAKGFGETRFIATNKTKAGRAENRRVDFVILEVDGKPLPKDELESATGKELKTN